MIIYPYKIDSTTNGALEVAKGQAYVIMPARSVHGATTLIAPVQDL